MPDEKDDNHAPLDKVRGDRGLARGSGFIAKRVRDLARDVKDRELVGRGENNGFESEWGSEGSGPGEFNGPTAIAVDKDGNVLVADNGNSRIQKFDANGRFLDTWEIYADDSGKSTSESDSELDVLRIVVDETGTISLINVYGGKWAETHGYAKEFLGKLDPKEGVFGQWTRDNQSLKSMDEPGYLWAILFGFVHPNGNVYIRHDEPTQGVDQIVIFSKNWKVTGVRGARWAGGSPEQPYPMEQPLFTDNKGDIYSLFPGQNQPVAGDDREGWWTSGARSLKALAIHSTLVRCRNSLDESPGFSIDHDSDPKVTECTHSIGRDSGLRDELTIGRSPDNTIVVDGSTVSRHHARIEFSERAYFIEDLDSRNGTTVNGSPVTRARLGSQSSIKVGKETIKFFYPAWAPRLWQILSETAPIFVRDRHFGAPDINPVILKFSPECEPIEVWAPELRDPHLETGSFAVNVDGGVFFLCGGCNEVKELSKDGNLVDEWGEEGTGPGQFDGPMGIAAGPANEIYVADTGNHRIQKFRTSVKA
jgi:hypothetical protein